MSKETNIEWADHTGSPWYVCTEVNEDCANCYARELAVTRMEPMLRRAYEKMGVEDANFARVWGKGAPRVRSKGFWTDALKWNKTPWVCDSCGKGFTHPQQHKCPSLSDVMAFTDEVNWHRARMFPSLCDWLDEEAPVEWFVEFLKLVYNTDNLIWMLLTKRPGVWRSRMLQALNWMQDHTDCMMVEAEWNDIWWMVRNWLDGYAPKNVWVFVSAGSQKRADEMIPLLLQIPAPIHGVSAEPLLGLIDWAKHFKACNSVGTKQWLIDSLIVGGESTQGKPARECHIEQILSCINQCREHGVKVFVKQLGSNPREALAHGSRRLKLKHPKGGDMSEWPEDLRVREFPEAAYQ